MKTVLRLLYPPQCLTCGTLLQSDPALCGPCWRDTPFIGGLVCDLCGAPLPGREPAGVPVHCDACLRVARPWLRGRAAMRYDANARRLVLGLKHGDRQDFVAPMAGWLAAAAAPMLEGVRPVVVPVPLHWTRLLRRRYNQAALLGGAMARRQGYDFVPDALYRTRRTSPHERMNQAERFANLDAAICAHPRRAERLKGADVLLVDDVMTSGATMAAACEASHAAGAGRVFILSLARVAPPA